MERVVKTCYGDFVIRGRLAVCVADKDFYYELPSDNMTDSEIRAFFNELNEFET